MRNQGIRTLVKKINDIKFRIMCTFMILVTKILRIPRVDVSELIDWSLKSSSFEKTVKMMSDFAKQYDLVMTTDDVAYGLRWELEGKHPKGGTFTIFVSCDDKDLYSVSGVWNIHCIKERKNKIKFFDSLFPKFWHASHLEKILHKRLEEILNSPPKNWSYVGIDFDAAKENLPRSENHS